MTPEELYVYLAEEILKIQHSTPLRVGICGIDAAGKTFLADKLAEELKKSGRHIIRASVDGFHNPKEIRYKQGRLSPEGYYEDSFNYPVIISNVLDPLSNGGNLEYRTARFDYKTDSEVDSLVQTASKDSILIMEGVFLFRPELVDYWDLKIFLDIDFGENMRRAIERDKDYLGGKQQVVTLYNMRYAPGQILYFTESNPKQKADIVVDNNDFNAPRIVKP